MTVTLPRPSARNLTLLLFVSATEVSGIIVNTEQKEKVILLQKSTRIALHPKATEREQNLSFSGALYRLLHELEGALAHGFPHSTVRRVVLFYAVPFGVAGTLQITAHSSTRQTLTVSVIENAIREAEKKFLAESSRARFAVIEQDMVGAQLDGYPVQTYLLRSYQDFLGRLALGAVQMRLADKLSDICRSVFAHATIRHLTLDIPLLKQLSKLKDAGDNFLYVVVFPDRSIIVQVHDNAPLLTDSFSYGTDTMFASISHALKITKTVARSHLHLYGAGKLHTTSASEIEQAMEKALEVWLEALSLSLTKLESGTLLPKSIFILSYDETAGLLFQNRVKKEMAGYIPCGQHHCFVLRAESFIPPDAKLLPPPSSVIGALVSYVIEN